MIHKYIFSGFIPTAFWPCGFPINFSYNLRNTKTSVRKAVLINDLQNMFKKKKFFAIRTDRKLVIGKSFGLIFKKYFPFLMAGRKAENCNYSCLVLKKKNHKEA